MHRTYAMRVRRTKGDRFGMRRNVGISRFLPSLEGRGWGWVGFRIGGTVAAGAGLPTPCPSLSGRGARCAVGLDGVRISDRANASGYRTVMADPRIIDVQLDETSLGWRSPDVEQERRIAIFDLIEGNHFAPQRAYADGYAGPYKIKLQSEEGRLGIHIHREDDTHLETLVLALGRFRRPIRDYFAICDSYYQAIRQSSPAQIETVDMARRGIHNEAAELLKERLDGKIEVDFDTARRLFTLICVLHIRN